jgi:uncharacterized protein (TIGR04255 family)
MFRRSSPSQLLKFKPIPKKLKHDAIVEAVFEMRFDMESIPEILFGRLVDFSAWSAFQQRRLPAYDLPAPIRQADETLRYQAVFELNDVKANSSLRIGPQVVSYHQREPYGSWTTFRPRVEEAIDQLFDKAQNVKVHRLGLRYLNALRRELHQVAGVRDIDIEITVSEGTISESLNLNFTQSISSDMRCTVRIATPDFVQGVYPKDTAVFVDVDVFTSQQFRATDRSAVKTWLSAAHEREKEYFFGLLKTTTIDSLRED